MTPPTVHMNGSGGKELVRQMRAAGEALRAAIDALYEMAPHGRDYYTQERDCYVRARKEHDARIEALVAVQEQVQEMATAVFRQLDARGAQ